MLQQKIQISDFTYDLPENRIAKYPLAKREVSKLLIYKDSVISEDTFLNIYEHIPENSLLIYNDTKVMPARLLFKNSTGGRIEIFCLDSADESSDPTLAMYQTKSVKWKCLVGRLNKWKEPLIHLQVEQSSLSAELLQIGDTDNTVEFRWKPEEMTFAEVLDKFGKIPIPPYLGRESEEIDLNRYQTVYAKQEGSVAAPTAGLHFTDTVFDRLRSKNISLENVTLHVGAGTFKPVKSELIGDHLMHAEWIDVSIQTIKRILSQLICSDLNACLIPVGTTSLRTIESFYWMGVKANAGVNSTLEELEVKQWDPYELSHVLSGAESLESLLDWMNKNNLSRLLCKTQIMIVPSYELKIADALITNFHQPNSTLLLLVAAITGNDWSTIYNYALKNAFRFLSYGDGSLLFRNYKQEIE